MRNGFWMQAVLAASFLLSACGGGGSDGAVSSTAANGASGAGAASASSSAASAATGAASGSTGTAGTGSRPDFTNFPGGFLPTLPLVPDPDFSGLPDEVLTAYRKLATAAEDQRDAVEKIVVDGPCDTHDQCGVLSLYEYGNRCGVPSHLPYLLASDSAESVRAGIDRFNDLSRQTARAIPDWVYLRTPTACAMHVLHVAPTCDARKRKCVIGGGFDPVFLPVLEADGGALPR